ncbi:MAG: hypothetical protein CXZ00_03105 [Acidobacteria bacterium]|nr:MAG: hypothetical protein CXZ00_03105 [Acidobacteriota bacterium]
MAITPEVLQKRFNMEVSAHTKAVPRAIHAFIGETRSDKRMYLSTVYPLIMSGALPAEGQKRKFYRQVTQEELAAISGLKHRTSVTRRISRFANLAAGYDTPEARREHAMALRQAAKKRLESHRHVCDECKDSPCETAEKLSKKVHELKESYTVPTPRAVIRRHRRFGETNRYAHAIAGRATEMWAVVDTDANRIVKKFMEAGKAGKACDRITLETGRCHHVEAVALESAEYHFPSPAQLAAQPKVGAWWDAESDRKGYKAVSCWIWDRRIMDPDDPSSPLGTIERLVMSAYEQFGLMEEFRDAKTRRVSKPKGFLQIRQQKIADFLQISIKSVWSANRKWEALGVLRIVHEHDQTATGWVSGPQRVVYLPMRLLTEQEAKQEKARMETRVREIVAREGAQRLAQLMEAKRLHSELLEAWTGREHCMTAFYRELGRRFDGARIFPDLITKLIPPTRPPDPD